ncbi:hypothetical protein TRVA0_046S00320 [Trichomonascus vanleenenianus]|uniref:F-box protein n=1 Tax=Trichomonascus vanleenenianus TaxID=2268995 RepID=UPI003EC9974A
MEACANLLGLPGELRHEILDYLNLAEWRGMRLVSKQWNDLCQTRVWRKVAVGPTRDIILNFQDYKMFSDFDPDIWEVEYDPRDTYTALSYKQLTELAPNCQFQSALRNNTRELYLYYSHLGALSVEDSERVCEIMAGLFKSLNKVRLNYTPGSYNHGFPQLQRMLDKWKSTADFCLELVITNSDRVCIDVDGMRIKELFLHKPYQIEEDPLLPISNTDQKSPVKFTDLPSLCKDLVTLSLEIDRTMFRTHWIPVTTKYLHLRNNPGQYSSTARLVVPHGVECLYITDLFEFGWGADDTMVSILDCVDLEEATQLKVLSYKGPSVSTQLEQAILHTQNTLEELTVLCLKASSQGTDTFLELARQGLGLKQLRLSISVLGLFKDQVTFELPKLEQLQLDYYEIGFPREAHAELQCLENFVSALLRGCPRLSSIQLQSASKMDWTVIAGWIVPCSGRQRVLYNIDIPKAKALFVNH